MSEPEWTLPHVEPLAWATHAEGKEKPDLDVDMPEDTASKLKEGVHIAMDVIHSGADITAVATYVGKIIEQEPEALEGLEVAADMVGLVALNVLVPMIMLDTFETGLRVNEQQGFCYGVVWGALGPESEPKTMESLNNIHDEGERKAFLEGIEKGKEAVQQNPELKETVQKTVVYEYTRQGYSTISTPEGRTLNRIWEQVHDKDSWSRGTAAGVRDTALVWGQPGHMELKGDPKLDPLKEPRKHH